MNAGPKALGRDGLSLVRTPWTLIGMHDPHL